MKPITIFSWGYWGWGTATKQLLKAVASVEAERGFEPPVFIDVRWNRSVRAPGFNGGAFEKLCGKDGYCWMKSLGNRAISDDGARRIQIADPLAAHELLYRALDAVDQGRRAVFFCSCSRPKRNDLGRCHRTDVARLVLNVATRRSIPVEVVEWPGGKPRQFELDVKAQAFEAVARGRQSIPLGTRPDLSEVAGLPWGTVLKLRCRNSLATALVGPALYERKQWVLPIIDGPFESDSTLSQLKQRAPSLRRRFGYEPQFSM
jgi:hypothetical protein